MQNSVIEHQGRTPRTYQKLIFENNTIMNTGASGMRFGRPDTVIFKNNLVVNMGILGDAVYGDRDKFVEGYFFVEIDSVFTDTTNTELVNPVIEWTNNHFYFDPEVAALLPDSANSALETTFHPYMADLIGEENLNLMGEKFEFTNFPATIGEYQASIEDFYNQTEVRSDLPQFDTPYGDLDFSYAETAAAYSAATDGGPLGDRNWFPDWEPSGIGNITATEHFTLYPNPATGTVYISLEEGSSADRVHVSNILGQTVLNLESIQNSTISLNVENLPAGIYFVNLYRNSNILGTSKLMVK